MTEAFEPACFNDFKVGDRIKFVSANNGFGQSGDPVWRTGTVTRVTAKTIAVDCESNWFGDRAVIRSADWNARCPMKATAHRVEVDRFVSTLRGGTERRDHITISDADGQTVASAVQSFDSDLDLRAAIRQLGWELIGDLREVAGPRYLEGHVKAAPAQPVRKATSTPDNALKGDTVTANRKTTIKTETTWTLQSRTSPSASWSYASDHGSEEDAISRAHMFMTNGARQQFRVVERHTTVTATTVTAPPKDTEKPGDRYVVRPIGTTLFGVIDTHDHNKALTSGCSRYGAQCIPGDQCNCNVHPESCSAGAGRDLDQIMTGCPLWQPTPEA